jgi:TetR/AcrR family transcriptional repressor of nem operon
MRRSRPRIGQAIDLSEAPDLTSSKWRAVRQMVRSAADGELRGERKIDLERSFQTHYLSTGRVKMPWEKNFDVGEVIDKAMQAFWAHGYEATSMQDLVDCTGVNRGSLYATYGDKRTFFLAALRMYDEKMRRKLLADIEARCQPRAAIRWMFEAFLANVSERGDNRGCFLTNTALELASHDAEVGQIVAHGQKQIEAFFARMIRKAKAKGEIPAHVKPTATARGLLALLIGLVVLSRSRPEKVLLQGIVDDALRRLE